MKKNLFIITLIPIIILFILLIRNTLLSNKLKECMNKTNINICNIEDKEEIQEDNYISTNIYNCKFTVTYRIVDLLDGYIAEVPEYSSIVVDKFQIHNPIAHLIPTILKSNLELNKYYEFTYHIKGIGNIEDIYDVINNIREQHTNNNNLSVTLSIKETNRLGLEQIQENICK